VRSYRREVKTSFSNRSEPESRRQQLRGRSFDRSPRDGAEWRCVATIHIDHRVDRGAAAAAAYTRRTGTVPRSDGREGRNRARCRRQYGT